MKLYTLDEGNIFQFERENFILRKKTCHPEPFLVEWMATGGSTTLGRFSTVSRWTEFGNLPPGAPYKTMYGTRGVKVSGLGEGACVEDGSITAKKLNERVWEL